MKAKEGFAVATTALSVVLLFTSAVSGSHHPSFNSPYNDFLPSAEVLDAPSLPYTSRHEVSSPSSRQQQGLARLQGSRPELREPYRGSNTRSTSEDENEKSATSNLHDSSISSASAARGIDRLNPAEKLFVNSYSALNDFNDDFTNRKLESTDQEEPADAGDSAVEVLVPRATRIAATRGRMAMNYSPLTMFGYEAKRSDTLNLLRGLLKRQINLGNWLDARNC